MPFINFSYFGDKIKPCCRFYAETDIVEASTKHIKPGFSMDDIFFSPEYDKLRASMLKGEKISGCFKCYNEEDAGGLSMRQGSYDNFKDLLDSKNTPRVRILEIGFSNICNLKCRTCSSGLSTAWIEDDKYLQKHFSKKRIAQKKITSLLKLKDKDIKNLKYIKFVGGEPMLNPEYNDFIQRMLSCGAAEQARIELFTNTSYLPSTKAINDLKRFESVRVHLSIDGIGKRNEYIRFPSYWPEVIKAAGKWLKDTLDSPQIVIQMEPTVSIYNIYYLEEQLDWWIKLNKSVDSYRVNVHFINAFYPPYISYINLPKDLKEIVADKITKMLKKYAHIKIIKNNLTSLENTLWVEGKNELPRFIEYNKHLDKIRKENFDQVFPEWSKLINEYKNARR